MADTYTAKFNFTKPEVNSSRDTWGTKNNGNLDILDNVLDAHERLKLPWNPTTKLVTADFDFQGPTRQRFLTAKTAGNIRGNEAAVLADLLTAVPIGLIVLWYGVLANIPPGWTICNGQNGTPDLQGRFVMGAGSTGAGTIGGANSHFHNIQATALNINQIPSHAHGVNDPGHNHYVNDPGHAHSFTRRSNRNAVKNSNVAYDSTGYSIGDENAVTAGAGTGIYLSGAATGISTQANGGNGGHTHGMDLADHRPPFMALIYIMKISQV